MKRLLCLFCCMLFGCLLHAQEFKGLSQGGPIQKNYFTKIPYKQVKDKLIIHGEINGKTYTFLLDTGAPTAISAELAKEFKAPLITKMEIADQSGIKDSMQVVSLSNIKLGDVTFKDIPTLVIKDFGVMGCLKVDGFIGSNMLRNSVVQFSSKDKTVTITDKAKLLNLDRKNMQSMDINAGQATPFIRVEFITGIESVSEDLVIDTGMSGFYDMAIDVYYNALQYNLLKTLGSAVGSYTLGIYGAAKPTENYKVLIHEMALGNNSFTNITASTTSDRNSRIGSEILDYGIMTLDYKNGRFYFEPYKKADNINLGAKSWPFNVILEGDKMKVGIVWDESVNTTIKTGDEILKFGHLDYEKMDTCEMLVTSIKSLPDTATLKLKDVTTGAIKELKVEKQ